MVMFATGGKIYHVCSCTANKTFKKKINNDGHISTEKRQQIEPLASNR